jgi:diguanylate cyclase (GGDEF)-like protein
MRTSGRCRERTLSRASPTVACSTSTPRGSSPRVAATDVYADLDRFKQVNDVFGHSEGDRLLGEVATLIKEGLRNTDIVARLGGDEFGILMPDAGEEQARVTLERVADTLAQVVGGRWPVGVTFGAVTFRQPPEDADRAVRMADELMYKGKSQGRGLVVQATWPGSADQEHRRHPGGSS